MSRDISISRLRTPRNVSNVDKIVTNTPASGSDSGGSTTWVPENEAMNYVNKETLDVSENGTYTAKDGTYYNEVKVDVDGSGSGSGGDGGDTTELIDEKVIKANGTYYAIDDATNTDAKEAGYEKVNVQVPLIAKVITANGQYDATDDISAEGDPAQGYSSVEVRVTGDGGRKIKKLIKANGTYKASDEDVGEDEEPVSGYSEVDVALPMVRKNVTKNGTFNASDEQDSNGDDAIAYSEVEVGVQILQPSFDFIMKVDRKKNKVNLPFDISISNTAESDYGDYEKQHNPQVNFRNANIYLFTSGGGNSPFRVPNFNFGSGFCHSWPQTITMNGTTRKINNYNEAWAYTRLNNWANDVVKEGRGRIKYIKHGQFTSSGRGFVIAGDYAAWGYQCWIVPNVSYSKDQYYSFAITISVPHN